MTSATPAVTPRRSALNRANETPGFNWRRSVGRIPLHIAIIFIALVWILPTFGLLITSFRTQADINTSGWWTVLKNPLDFTQYTLENYDAVINNPNYDMARAFRNSLLIAIPGTFFPLLFAASAAYAFSWMNFRGRQTLFVVLVGMLVVPLQLTFIPVLTMFNKLGITNNPYIPFLGIWIAHTAYGLPYAIYLLRNYMGSLPREIFESAYLDGCSHITAFLRLALPLSIPAIASLVIFQFLWVWNDLLVALIYVGGGRNAPLTYALSGLINSLGQGWHLLTAAAFVSMALPLVVFLALQRYFVRGILAGSVKG
ncbi:MAG: carbohydrate ABC transporter permease [Anaerolineae bacterium]|nr:carbohydrate ABC transporter permease [Anaerolineae bacterium]